MARGLMFMVRRASLVVRLPCTERCMVAHHPERSRGTHHWGIMGIEPVRLRSRHLRRTVLSIAEGHPERAIASRRVTTKKTSKYQ